MQLNYGIASLFLSQSFMCCNNSTSFAFKLHIPSSGDDNTDSVTRSQHRFINSRYLGLINLWSQCAQSLITYGIIDKTVYLSKATK